MIDPMTGAMVPDGINPAALTPEIQTMIASAMPPGMTPPVLAGAPFGAHGDQNDPNKPWQGAPGQGFLHMLQRIQTANPQLFTQLMAGAHAARFGITPENLATMQSRQDLRQEYKHPVTGQPMPGPATDIAPVAQPPQSVMPPTPVTPAAPAMTPPHQIAPVQGWGGGIAGLGAADNKAGFGGGFGNNRSMGW